MDMDNILENQERKKGKDEWEKKLIKESYKILEYAKEEVNFDSGEIEILESAIETEELPKIIIAVTDAKSKAAEKLDGGYQEFCRYLLKKKGLLSAEN